MKWRTDKPTREEQISQVADILFCNTETGQLSIEKCYELAEKIVTKEGANLKEGETVTDWQELGEEVVSICKKYGITEHLDAELGPLDIKNIARHFAKWGAEHLKK